MHTVHLADETNKANMFAAAMGIMYSVNDYDKGKCDDACVKVIDTFFDNLKWEETNDKKRNVKVNEVTYGELMMMVDMDNRWTYKGSVTTPPCAENVYWNVVRTVYPIKARHLQQFKDEMALDGLEKTGNFRLIQELTESHNPVILVSGGRRMGGLFLILFIVFLVISLALCVMVMNLRKAASQEPNQTSVTPKNDDSNVELAPK